MKITVTYSLRDENYNEVKSLEVTYEDNAPPEPDLIIYNNHYFVFDREWGFHKKANNILRAEDINQKSPNISTEKL